MKMRLLVVLILLLPVKSFAVDAFIKRLNGQKAILRIKNLKEIEKGKIYDIFQGNKNKGSATVLKINAEKKLLLTSFKGDEFLSAGDKIQLTLKKHITNRLKSKRDKHFGYLHGMINSTKTYALSGELTLDGVTSTGFGFLNTNGLGFGLGYDHFYRFSESLPYLGAGASFEFSRNIDNFLAGNSRGTVGGTFQDHYGKEVYFPSNINFYAKVLFPINDMFDFSAGVQLNLFGLTLDSEYEDPLFTGIGTHAELSTNFSKFRISLMYRSISIGYTRDKEPEGELTLAVNELLLKGGIFF